MTRNIAPTRLRGPVAGSKPFRIAIIVLAVMICAVPSGAAHAGPLRASPMPGSAVAESPAVIWMEFNEPVFDGSTAMQLSDTNGTPIAISDVYEAPGKRYTVDVLVQLVPGAYVLEFQTISTIDGHPTDSAWGFVVGNGTVSAGPELQAPPVLWWATIGKAVALVGLAAVAGAATTRYWAPERAAQSLRPRTVFLARVGAALYVLGASILLVDTWYTFGQPVLDLVARSGFFQVLVARWFLGLAILLWLISASRRAGVLGPVLLTAVMTLAVLHGWTSHAAARADARWMGALLDSIHLIAVLAWTGGIFHLLLALRPNRIPPPADVLASMTLRFGAMAMGAVITLALTGAALSVLLVGWPTGWTTQLLHSSYAFVLANKVLLAFLMIALGGINHILFTRRYRTGRPTPPAIVFQDNVRREAVNGLLVLLLAASLSGLSPT